MRQVLNLFEEPVGGKFHTALDSRRLLHSKDEAKAGTYITHFASLGLLHFFVCQ